MDGEGTATAQSPEKERQSREWAMFLHLSVLLGTVAPVIGLAAPIVIWQMKKDQMPIVDVHGKNVVNWIISLLVYGAISIALTLVVIGIPLLIILATVSIIFPIIGGVKANNGEVWKYPMALQFIK
jgi:uncharacterized protein